MWNELRFKLIKSYFSLPFRIHFLLLTIVQNEHLLLSKALLILQTQFLVHIIL